MKTHYNLVFISNILDPIDLALASYRVEIPEHPNPDTFGLIDEYEQFYGIGFAICQTFLASVHKGENKFVAFKKGFFHSTGKSYAEITNACANYWKHSDEWDKTKLSKQAKATTEVFEKLSVDVWGTYPLSNMFYVLLGENATFKELLSYLNGWANEKPNKAVIGIFLKDFRVGSRFVTYISKPSRADLPSRVGPCHLLVVSI